MIEHLIADAAVADYERAAKEQNQVRLAKKLFPRRKTERVEREPVNAPVRKQPQPDPLLY